MNGLDYLQDNRTFNQYKNYCNKGFYNQEIVIKKIQEETNLDIRLNKKESFKETMEEIGRYEADALILVGIKWCPVEIKVSQYEPREYVDIKQHQIDKIAGDNGYLLYASETRYGFFRAREAKEIGLIPKHSNRINKMCYEIPTGLFNWFYWKDKLNIQKYDR